MGSLQHKLQEELDRAEREKEERMMTEEDPTAIDSNEQEPDEESLPDKPPIEDMPDDILAPPSDQEEIDAEHEVQLADPDEAAQDDTIDDKEVEDVDVKSD